MEQHIKRADSCIYFPFINVPNSRWFLRQLLYWDRVHLIVPTEFIEDPDLLEPVTRQLMQRELVFPVPPIPTQTFGGRFESQFLAGMDEILNGPELQKRQASFNSGNRTWVHGSKMSYVGETLSERGLAVMRNRPPTPEEFRAYADQWYEVESKTADEYMASLAVSMGLDHELIPISDDPRNLSDLKLNVRNVQELPELERVRSRVLRGVLPVPTGTRVTPEQIAEFKFENQKLLTKHRQYLEKEVVEINAGRPSDYRLDGDVSELAERKRQIHDRSRASAY